MKPRGVHGLWYTAQFNAFAFVETKTQKHSVSEHVKILPSFMSKKCYPTQNFLARVVYLYFGLLCYFYIAHVALEIINNICKTKWD